jgi:uncharacterized protein (UPF0303 family)
MPATQARRIEVGVVAAVTVSGLTSDEDHHFVIDGLTRYAEGHAVSRS